MSSSKDTFCRSAPYKSHWSHLHSSKWSALISFPEITGCDLHFTDLAPIGSAFPKFIFCKLCNFQTGKHSAFPLQSESQFCLIPKKPTYLHPFVFGELYSSLFALSFSHGPFTLSHITCITVFSPTDPMWEVLEVIQKSDSFQYHGIQNERNSPTAAIIHSFRPPSANYLYIVSDLTFSLILFISRFPVFASSKCRETISQKECHFYRIHHLHLTS